jgi:ATP-dependent Clp protease ATP-binding subunit ClpA
MFERYTERARRVLFFARYEASQLGSISIETEHLLLGLIREGKGLTSRIFARSHLSLENIRKEIEGRTVFREKVSTSVEIPFSAETKRVLQFAAECGDAVLDEQARKYLALTRFSILDPPSSILAPLIWGSVTVEWGNDLAPSSPPNPSPTAP